MRGRPSKTGIFFGVSGVLYSGLNHPFGRKPPLSQLAQQNLKAPRRPCHESQQQHTKRIVRLRVYIYRHTYTYIYIYICMCMCIYIYYTIYIYIYNIYIYVYCSASGVLCLRTGALRKMSEDWTLPIQSCPADQRTKGAPGRILNFGVLGFRV